jgi:hypothetical protein
MILDELVANGVLGVLLMLALFVNVFLMAFNSVKSLMRGRQHQFMAAFVACGVASLFSEGAAANITPTYGLWVLCGLAIAIERVERTARREAHGWGHAAGASVHRSVPIAARRAALVSLLLLVTSLS